MALHVLKNTKVKKAKNASQFEKEAKKQKKTKISKEDLAKQATPLCKKISIWGHRAEAAREQVPMFPKRLSRWFVV